jgi:hypothetical protein
MEGLLCWDVHSIVNSRGGKEFFIISTPAPGKSPSSIRPNEPDPGRAELSGGIIAL